MKKIAAVSTNEIARYAVKNIVKNNSDALTSTAKAIEMETMKKRMMRGEVVRFAYMKLNGEIRIAVGTLQPQAVAANVNGNVFQNATTVCSPISTLRRWIGEVSKKNDL